MTPYPPTPYTRPPTPSDHESARRLNTPWAVSLAILLVGCSALLNGCLSSAQPNPPPHWHREVLEPTRGSKFDGSKLQVIVTYDESYSTHAALRLADAGEGTLFWDPAGRYGEMGDGTYTARMKRVNDLIVENEPSVEMYWASSVNGSDTAMEVFEWDLSRQQAWRIRKTLLQGARLDGDRKDFHTKTTKPFCSSAISGFLMISDDNPAKLENTYLLPHDMAEALYRAGPSRVVVFRRGRKAAVYTNGQSS